MPQPTRAADPHAHLQRGDRVMLEATDLRNCWAVRPAGQLGTMGYYPCAWTVQYVKAPSATEAVRRAEPYYKR